MKTYILIIAAVLIYGAGMFTHFKLQKAPTCPKCPDMKCPPSVNVQQLQLDNIRKIKGDFSYSPVFNGDVYMVQGKDTIKN